MHTLSTMILQTEFVEHIPEKLEQGVLYVSMAHTVAMHLCVCGCGEEVITPLHPRTGWIQSYDGLGLTLRPSIGNWNFDCKSHYFITKSKVDWCPKWMDRDWRERQKPHDNIEVPLFEDKQETKKKRKWPKLKKKKNESRS
jgi:hypothetical protein